MTTNTHIILKEWMELAQELEHHQGRFLVFVLGENDTGKSSICHYLVSHLSSQGRQVAWIDADLGQSILGPPTCVGMTISPPFSDKGEHLSLRFVGATSPVGHLLQTLVAVRIQVDKAIQQKVEGIILDTSGFISGKMGLEFKFQKIELVNPTHLIALQKGKELEAILRNFSYRKTLSIRRFPVPEDVIRPKSIEQRWRYRREQFQRYFSKATLISFSFRGLGLHGHLPDFHNPADWQGLLIGFCDEMNDTLALGIIQEVKISKKQLFCLTPLGQETKVRSIQFGTLHLDQSGQELLMR